MHRQFATIALGTALVLLPLRAQKDTANPSLHVHGESLVSVAPDEVELDLGVVSEADTAETASAQNTLAVTRITESLRTILPEANIKSINLSVNPNFRYPKEGAPVISKYSATNTLRVTLDKLDLLRPVIGASTKSGASSINRLNFTLRAESERRARAQALAEAAAQATAGATALAGSLKLKLGRILRVEEGQPLIVSPAPQIDLGKAQSTDMAPISPGYIQIHANVNLEYEIVYPPRT